MVFYYYLPSDYEEYLGHETKCQHMQTKISNFAIKLLWSNCGWRRNGMDKSRDHYRSKAKNTRVKNRNSQGVQESLNTKEKTKNWNTEGKNSHLHIILTISHFLSISHNLLTPNFLQRFTQITYTKPKSSQIHSNVSSWIVNLHYQTHQKREHLSQGNPKIWHKSYWD